MAPASQACAWRAHSRLWRPAPLGRAAGRDEQGTRACAAPCAATAAAAMSRARSSCPRSARTTCASSLASVRDASSSCAPRTAGRRWPRGGRQHKCAVHAAADLCGSAERLLQARRLPHAGLGRRVGCGGDLGSLRRSPRSGARPGPAVACRAVRDKADRQPGLKSGCASQRPAGGDAGPCLCGALSASCVRQVTGRRRRNEKCLRPRGHVTSHSSALHGCSCGTACAPGTRVLGQRTVAVLTSVVAPPSAAKWCPCPQGKNLQAVSAVVGPGTGNERPLVAPERVCTTATVAAPPEFARRQPYPGSGLKHQLSIMQVATPACLARATPHLHRS